MLCVQTCADSTCWDAFVAQDPHGHLLQTWAWGELKARFGWTPVRWFVLRDGQPIVGAQVLYRRIGPFSFGYIPKGPVGTDESGEAWQVLWRAIHRASRKRLVIALRVELPQPETERTALDRLTTAGFRPTRETIQPRRTIIVDLAATDDEMLARMKSKWRYNIRLAERKGIVVQESDDIGAFYRLMELTGRRDTFGVHSEDYYRHALGLFVAQGRAKLFLAYCEGQPLAGLMVYAFNGQAYYMYGASSNDHREFMPNHLLQWRAMQWAKSVGCTSYDLWGIPDVDPDSPSAELTGVGNFKAGFGGQVVRYPAAYDYAYSRILYAAWQYLWARRHDRRSPHEPQASNSA